MRALIDVSTAQVDALDALAKRERRSRAALIREAIGDYLERRNREQVADGFGLWGKGKQDGLAYENKVRREW